MGVAGTWVTADGPPPPGAAGRRALRRGPARTGGRTVTGSHLDDVDDTGFTATGDVRDGVVHHEHLALHREG
ncbi:Atu4866 domain-containing protein [Saccharopolyspora gregorii]|uniref:Atu4866 domain-containing protein n=1 Tax=Saccharopolyspora gregorii TaxID=33914 RepID=A0ABP6RSH3_9PSEU